MNKIRKTLAVLDCPTVSEFIVGDGDNVYAAPIMADNLELVHSSKISTPLIYSCTFPDHARGIISMTQWTRFGREDLLVQIYVRDLLTMAHSGKRNEITTLRDGCVKLDLHRITLPVKGICLYPSKRDWWRSGNCAWVHVEEENELSSDDIENAERVLKRCF
ncbi:hypothetical protein TNCV_4967621 [Trichonephila clavipes]|nr:hypothetical protein TNCV_4967621 [Trichonephila clavipes]